MANNQGPLRLNMVTMLQQGLEREVKKELIDSLVKQELVSFEEKLRDILKPIVESITIGRIQSMRDLMTLREELYVHIKYNDEKPEVTVI